MKIHDEYQNYLKFEWNSALYLYTFGVQSTPKQHTPIKHKSAVSLVNEGPRRSPRVKENKFIKSSDEDEIYLKKTSKTLKVNIKEEEGVCPICHKKREEHEPRTTIPSAVKNSTRNKINRCLFCKSYPTELKIHLKWHMDKRITMYVVKLVTIFVNSYGTKDSTSTTLKHSVSRICQYTTGATLTSKRKRTSYCRIFGRLFLFKAKIRQNVGIL